MKILNYTKFVNEAFLHKDKELAIKTILESIKKKTGQTFHPYDEIWNIQKGSIFLRGQLFLSAKKPKALRFNWIEGDISSELHSIDLWENFIFEKKPDWTMELSGLSVVSILPDVVDFLRSPATMVTEAETPSYDDPNPDLPIDDPSQKLAAELTKLSRMRSPERKEQQQAKIEKIKIMIAKKETASTDSQKVNQLDPEIQRIDVFKMIELYTIQVARKKSNSLIISGDAGVGKTATVKDTLESMGLVKDYDYFMATGTVTTAGLYELLFKNRNSLLVFDDCDAVFKDADSVNILKGALDTYEVREISKLTKGNTFDSKGMDEEEIEEEYQNSGKLPNKFQFKGQIIFISNIPEDKFDKAILSRSLHIDVHLSKRELFERMKNILRKISPDVEMDKKVEALEFFFYVCDNFPTKFDLNIRTLIHSVNLRANNEEEIEVPEFSKTTGEQIGSRMEPVWKVLVQGYLVKSR